VIGVLSPPPSVSRLTLSRHVTEEPEGRADWLTQQPLDGRRRGDRCQGVRGPVAMSPVDEEKNRWSEK